MDVTVQVKGVVKVYDGNRNLRGDVYFSSNFKRIVE